MRYKYSIVLLLLFQIPMGVCAQLPEQLVKNIYNECCYAVGAVRFDTIQNAWLIECSGAQAASYYFYTLPVLSCGLSDDEVDELLRKRQEQPVLSSERVVTDYGLVFSYILSHPSGNLTVSRYMLIAMPQQEVLVKEHYMLGGHAVGQKSRLPCIYTALSKGCSK